MLWLKCRLALRGQLGSKSSSAGSLLLVIFTYCCALPAAFFLGVFFRVMPPERASEVLHMALLFMYVFWISFPVTGYRMSDFIDSSKLLPYPVPPVRLFAAATLASLLDLSTLAMLPFMGSILLGHAGSAGDVLVMGVTLLLFMLHTLALAQVALLVLTHLFNLRFLAEALLVIIPLFVVVVLLVGEVLYLVAGSTFTSLIALPIPIVVGFLPPGVAARAILDTPGSAGGGLLPIATLAALTLLTLVLGGWLTEGLLLQSGPIETVRTFLARIQQRLSRRPTRRGSATALGLVLQNAARRVLGPALTGLWLKELRLVTREPQIRMSLAVLIVVALVTFFVGRNDPLLPQGLLLLYLLATGSIFFFSGAFLNGLAFEREGIRFLMAAPIAAPTIFLAKNLALWSLITSLQVPGLLLGCWQFGCPASLAAFLLLTSQILTICVLGAGNIPSAFPYKLPAKGVQVSGGPGAGRTFLAVVLGSIAISSGFGGAFLACLWMIVPLALWGAGTAAFWLGFPAALLTALALWAVATGIATVLVENRREKILQEILD